MKQKKRERAVQYDLEAQTGLRARSISSLLCGSSVCACVVLLAHVCLCVCMHACKGNIMHVNVCVHAYMQWQVCVSARRQVMAKVVDSCQCTWTRDGKKSAGVCQHTALPLPLTSDRLYLGPSQDNRRPLVPFRDASSRCKCERGGLAAMMSTS